MKSYIWYSFGLHALFLFGLMTMGTLLSSPSKSYYSIDLMSSAPSGGGQGTGPTVTAEPVAKAIPVPEAVKIKVPKAAPPAPRAPREEAPADDTMQMLAKLKKKRLAQPKRDYEDASPRNGEDSSQGEEAGATSQKSGGHGGGGIGTGPGIVADAGTPFPFPWYLKAIADRLDKQWKPPQAYAPDTVCQVTFVINRMGQISGSQITKSSKDSLFDELALRAVLYANPMPPLPNGFPESSLKVHMKFVGKQ